jgi:hypothetical protein
MILPIKGPHPTAYQTRWIFWIFLIFAQSNLTGFIAVSFIVLQTAYLKTTSAGIPIFSFPWLSVTFNLMA